MKDDLATCENFNEQVYAVFHFLFFSRMMSIDDISLNLL